MRVPDYLIAVAGDECEPAIAGDLRAGAAKPVKHDIPLSRARERVRVRAYGVKLPERDETPRSNSLTRPAGDLSRQRER